MTFDRELTRHTARDRVWVPKSDEDIPDSWVQGSLIECEEYDGRVMAVWGE